MANKKHLSLRLLPVAFVLLLAAMIVATLYPFNFMTPNRVQWLSDEPGLYFDGIGIVYTHRAKSISVMKAVSVELLLKERFGSRNWGPKEIFSFDDGAASPSLLVGQWGGRIFIYSRFEKNEGDKWYRLFRTKDRFPRGEVHFVTVTFGGGEKSIFIDGRLSDRKKVDISDTANIEFSGRFLLGNSPRGKHGWWGEIKGLAVYNRVLPPEEILTHSVKVSRKGMSVLAKTPNCLALYPFNEGEGNTVKSISGEPRPFYIPASRNALATTLLSLPYRDMRINSGYVADFLNNIIFFVPFGILLTMIILRTYAVAYFPTFLIVTLAGGLLSFVIEVLQLFLPTRTPGLADIFGNILGSGLGTLIAFTLKKLIMTI
jgi:glycopeptide antibiotics resistance protein